MAEDTKIRINELFLRVEAATLAKQYNVVEELLLQAENNLETSGISAARDKGEVIGVGFLNSRHLY